MESLIKIDESSYEALYQNYHQLKVFENIFFKLNFMKTNFNVYFEYDIDKRVYTTFFLIKNKDQIYESPFIDKKNRIFKVENILIPEKYLELGENFIYILNEILNKYKIEITMGKVVEQLQIIDSEPTNPTG